MSRKVNIFNVLSSGFSCPDADVTAFFAKTEFSEANLASWLSSIGKTYDEVVEATCNLITSWKAHGIYNAGGSDAVYLPIGNTSAQRKFNFYDPQDTDAAFRLVFNGGISFGDFTIIGNGINGYSETFWNTSDNASNSSGSFATDILSTATSGTNAMGSLGPGTALFWHNVSGRNIEIANGAALTYAGSRDALLFTSRVASNSNQSYKDGVSFGSNTSVYTPNTVDILLNAGSNNGSPSFYCPQELSMVLLSGHGYTPSEVADFHTDYNVFKTALGI